MKVLANEEFKVTRIKKGFSLVGLADSIGVSKQAMGQIERRDNGVSPENAQKIIKLLGVKFDDVFDLVDRVGLDG